MARPEATPESPGSRALVVDIIRSAGPISRTELTTVTGLTQPAISLIVRKLLDAEVIIEAGTAPSTGGKPRRLLDINRRARHGVGVHLGLESATLVATDTNGGMVARERLPYGATGTPNDMVDRLSRSIHAFMTTADIPTSTVQGVAVALPAPMSAEPYTDIQIPTLLQGRDTSLRAELESSLKMPVLVNNDASAAALGEFWSRGVSRYRSFACVYIGSGIGAGVVVDGALFRGSSSHAAELGHITVDPAGPECFCGNVGCLEATAAPRVVVARALEDEGVAGSLDLDVSATVAQNWEVLSRSAVDGHPLAESLITTSAHAVASAVLTLTNLFDIDEVVLSGPGVTTVGSIFVREVRTAVRRAYARKTHPTAVELSINPTDSAAIGAAALTLQGELTPGHGPALQFTEP